MWDWITKLAELRERGTPAVLVTVTGATGSTPREPGAKMIVLAGGEIFGTIGGGHLEELATKDACLCLAQGESRSIRYPLGAKTGQCCGGTVECFFELVNNGPALYLFGAGHVGQAVCRTLEGTPFTVHLVDERPEWIRSERLPAGVIRHECEWDEFARAARWSSEKTFVGIMTHRHDLDQEIVRAAIARPARYVGLIGSASKWERFQQRLTLRGVSESELARVTCPIGIDTGGKAPQEVAISFAAELLAIYYGRQEQRAQPLTLAPSQELACLL